MFKYYLYKFGQFCVHKLPLKAAYAIAAFISTMQYVFSPRDRRAVRNNLKIIAPDVKNIESMTREVFINFGKYLVEFFRMAKDVNQEYLKKNVKVVNVHHVEEALKRGKGGIILAGHSGNWELGAVILTTLGFPVTAIAMPHKERPVNDLFNGQREALGVKIVQISGAIRECTKALHQNRLVAILADRDFTQHGEVMKLFGKKTMIPKGAAAFCLKTGAPIIPAACMRERDGTFTMTLSEPLFAPKEGDEHQKLLQLIRQYTFIIEDIIRKNPSQWLMFRPFWIS